MAWVGGAWGGAERGVDPFTLQWQCRLVKDGSIRRLNIATENMNKTNLPVTYHSLHPLLTTAGFQSGAPAREPDTLMVEVLVSCWELGCTSCKHSDLMWI